MTRSDTTTDALSSSLPSLDVILTVVIPTYNRLARLRRVLDALAEQTVALSSFEVIVVSDGSTDGTVEHLVGAPFPYRLTVLSQENAGPAAARNRGVEASSAPLILFVDDDVVPDPGLIEEHLAVHSREAGDVVVIGPMLTPTDHQPSPFVRWEQAMLYKQYEAMECGEYEPTYRQFYTGNASVSRRLLCAAGGFDERWRRAEDVELAYRIHRCQARFIFATSAKAYHYAERSYDSWIHVATDYGRNEVAFIRERQGWDRIQPLRREFVSRHRLIKMVAWLCVGHPHVETLLEKVLLGLIGLGKPLGWERGVHNVLSVIYNVRYYSALAGALGGRKAFRDLMSAGCFPGLREN